MKGIYPYREVHQRSRKIVARLVSRKKMKSGHAWGFIWLKMGSDGGKQFLRLPGHIRKNWGEGRWTSDTGETHEDPVRTETGD